MLFCLIARRTAAQSIQSQIRGCLNPSHLENAMTTPGGRRLWIIGLLCLFVLTLSPVSSAQKLMATDVPVLVKQLKNKDAKIRAAAIVPHFRDSVDEFLVPHNRKHCERCNTATRARHTCRNVSERRRNSKSSKTL
jgi:hypothetical protein